MSDAFTFQPIDRFPNLNSFNTKFVYSVKIIERKSWLSLNNVCQEYTCWKRKHDVHLRRSDRERERKKEGEREKERERERERERKKARAALSDSWKTFRTQETPVVCDAHIQSRSLAYASLIVGAWQIIY